MAFKKDGIEIINSMIGKFQGIVDGLDEGLTLCQDKKDKNDKVINSLISENDFIQEKTEEAKTFRDNLKSMMTQKNKENN